MKAIICHELPGPAALRLEEVAEPQPGPGQVRVRVRACGVNFADSLITRGQYQSVSYTHLDVYKRQPDESRVTPTGAG